MKILRIWLVAFLILISPVISRATIEHSYLFVSCNAVTTTGACSAGMVDIGSRVEITYTTVVTGAPTAVTMNLEGSLDKVNWFTLDTMTTTTSDMRHVVNKSVMHLRGNLATLTGGTSPTVTVAITVRGG